MKVVFANAPFFTCNGEFLNIKHNITKNKMHSAIEALFDYEVPWIIKKILGTDKRKSIEYRYGVRAGSRWPLTATVPNAYAPYPFMLGYSASLLKENGFEVELIDSVVSQNRSYKKFIKNVIKNKPDIVVLETAALTENIDLWCAEKISKFAEVALAGPHFTDEIIAELQKKAPFVQYFLKGEYIKSSLKMAKTRQKGVYESDIVTDLDSIPFPYRDFKDAECYFDLSMPTDRPQLQMYASKGCPFKCSFCMWPQTMYKGIVAQRTPEKIIEEIRENVKKYGYKSIFFDDDTFNIGTERISKLCDYLKEIGLPWTMMGRLDCSPDWLYDKMVDCGCVGMRFGIETFNTDCLKRINKGLERVDFLGTLQHICEKHPDLWIHLTVMKDMPGQTDEIHKTDMKILHDLGFKLNSSNIKRSFQLSTCVPYKGTKLYEQVKALIGEERFEKEAQYDGMQNTLMSKLNKEGLWK
jgi:radical SAM superfamily enzyme YgiQ (UPF0313 family)